MRTIQKHMLGVCYVPDSEVGTTMDRGSGAHPEFLSHHRPSGPFRELVKMQIPVAWPKDGDPVGRFRREPRLCISKSPAGDSWTRCPPWEDFQEHQFRGRRRFGQDRELRGPRDEAERLPKAGPLQLGVSRPRGLSLPSRHLHSHCQDLYSLCPGLRAIHNTPEGGFSGAMGQAATRANRFYFYSVPFHL